MFMWMTISNISVSNVSLSQIFIDFNMHFVIIYKHIGERLAGGIERDAIRLKSSRINVTHYSMYEY